MKILLKLCFLSLLAVCVQCQAQLLFTDYRYTEHNHGVTVLRIGNSSGYKTFPGAGFFIDAENNFLKTFKDGTCRLLKSATEYYFERNCHDYAWGPYMSCMCDAIGVQKEAWVMSDPSENWHDASLARGPSSLEVSLPGMSDFVFNSGDLAGLPGVFYDIFGNMLPLPTCPLNSLDDKPLHSALLVDWFTPAGVDPKYSVGIFESKWGQFGLFEHRWGPGHCPDYLGGAGTLIIFVPNWGFPPYLISVNYW